MTDVRSGRPSPRSDEIRCLLISPAPGRDPENGDVQYTRDLLADPPPGVSYVLYSDAMDSGALREMPSVRRPRALLRSLHSVPQVLVRAALAGARRLGLLLPDPVRWWWVEGAFDVVHVHCLPVALRGNVPPVVVTDSAGTYWYWTAARGMESERTWGLLRRERRAARTIGYIHPTARPDVPGALTRYFVAGGIKLAATLGISPDSLGVAPSGVPTARTVSRLTLDPPVLLFVARNFEIKGGPDVLAAFDIIKRTVPSARLVIAGVDEPDIAVEGVEWCGPLTRADLYDRVYPEADLFLYPTRFDVAPLVVAEAAAHGLPVIASDRFGLPDMVEDGVSGILLDEISPEALAAAVLTLLSEESRLRAMGAAALRWFGKELSVERRNDDLRTAYLEVISQRRGSGRSRL